MNYSELNDIELLELLLEEDGIKAEAKELAIERRNVTKAPASFQQRRLWFLYELEPTSSAYNICSVFKIQGKLNIEVLQEGFRELQRRHESLRTTFVAIDGTPWQIIHSDLFAEIELEDLSEYSLGESEKEIPKIVSSESDYAFDLSTGPLMRVRLFQLASDRYILTLTLHHIIADAWSVGVILEEVVTLYKFGLEKTSTALPELKIQYTDYALWQQEKYQDLGLEDSLKYWEKQLASLPILQFPTDFSRPRLQTFRGDLVKFTLPNSLTQRIRTFSQQEGADFVYDTDVGFWGSFVSLQWTRRYTCGNFHR